MLEPDAYEDDPYRHLTNQAGHAAFVGIGLALPLVWLGWPLWAVPVIVAVVYALGWEWGIQRYIWRKLFDWRDSLMDTACVTAGASMVAGFLTDLMTGTLCWIAWVVTVGIGALRRWQP